MGIQINGNNDIISALDGSWTAEGASINTSGILTATTFKGNIVGTAATFTGPVTIGGTLTYEDVTNIDSVGIVTARSGVYIPADDKYLKIGASNDLGFVHTSGSSYITNATGHLVRRSDVHKWESYDGSSEYARFTSDGDFCINRTGPIEDAKLSIQCDATQAAIGIQANHTNTDTDLITAFNSGGKNIVNITAETDNSPYLKFEILSGNTAVERFRVNHLGNVAIGGGTAPNRLEIINDHKGFAGDSAQPNATLLIKHGTSGSDRRWIGIGASTTGAWLQSSSPGGSGLAAPFWINKGGGDVTLGNDKLKVAHSGGIVWIGSFTQYGNSAFNASNGSIVATSSGQNTLKLIDSTAQAANVGARILLGGNYRSSGDASPFVELKSFKENGTDNNYAYGFKISTTPNSGSLTERLHITSTGNIGQSVTPSGWSTAQANDFFAYQIGSGMAMFGRGSGDLDRGGISVNYFNTASAQKYIGNGNANRIYMEDGSIVFSSAAANSSGADAAMTLNERMKIDVNGKILLGTTRTQYANDYYDDITINNSGGSGAAGGTGITMISNSSSWGALQFGDQDDDDCAYIKYDHNGNKFIFGIEDGSVRFWQTKAKTWFGTTGHGDGSRSTLFDLVGENQDPIGAWGQMGIYSSTSQAQDRGGSITFGGQDGTTARQYFAGIQGAKENSTSANYAGNLNFFTRPSGAVPKRRLRIESWGSLTAWEGPSQHNGNPGRLASGHIMTWSSTHVSGGLAVGWYPIIHLTDGCYLFMLKTGAHSSILFTASNGYDPSNKSYINVLHYTDNRNSSYLNVDGLRATSDGIIEVHLTASSSDYFEMQAQILGPEKINNSLSFYSTLTKQTGSPTINDTKYPLTYGTSAMQVENLRVDGSFSKAGGSFRIPHPLPALKDTKDLAHSFIEGPQCDNIYRGKIDLVDGTATVNLDSVSNMTEGTFVLLNRDVQCYTTNETGWTNIKGSVSGNTLTITAQDNSCTDTISWMVIGERQDDTIKSEKCAIADNDGNLIVEPDKFTNSGQAPDDSKPNLT